MAANFSIVTVLRYDLDLMQVTAPSFQHVGWNHDNASPFYLLDYHRDRMLKAAKHWDWQPAIQLLEGSGALANITKLTEEFVGTLEVGLLRLKLLVDSAGELTFEKGSIPSISLRNLFPLRLPPPGTEPRDQDAPRSPRNTLVVDDQSITRSEHTHFKTTQRSMYDAARQRANLVPGDMKEVLIVDEDSVMEASLTTPYFWRGGKWVTPPVSTQFSQDEGSGGQDGTSRRWALSRGLAVEEIVPRKSLVDGEECWISNGARGFQFAVLRI